MFGSYSRGEDVESSDIDIYLETPSKEEIKLEQFEKELGRSIQIFRFKNIQQVKNKDLANNIINGITLNGFLEVL
jgi:predicted nucleotidyltransferase